MKIFITILICILASIAQNSIPVMWHYIFGFAVGTICANYTSWLKKIGEDLMDE